MPLSPDKKEVLNGLTVYDYNLYNHNPNKISMPNGKRKKTVAITIHNTGAINVASNTTPAEQYVRATQNGNMNSVRVHYYVDDVCAWRCMPDDYVNWSCADGTSNANSGNNTSVAIEVIGNSKKAEDNAVKLAAYLLNKYNLTVDSGLRSHTYWLNVRDGKKGTIDYLNTAKHPYKWCPVYILPHWSTFKANVKKSYDALTKPIESAVPTQKVEPAKYFRIRKEWEDAKSQIGAFTTLDNAIKKWQEGYFIFDWEGKIVYPEQVEAKQEVIDTTYCVYSRGKWNGDIVNWNDKDGSGFAGYAGSPINGIVAKAAKGQLIYKVHIKNGGWLSWIKKYEKNNWYNGCAGLKTQQIDAVQMSLEGLDGYQVKYRVSTIKNGFLPWVTGTEDYAGIIGNPIDKLQIEIVKL